MQRLLSFFLFLTFSSYSQLETSQWYFGGYAGLDFTTFPPTVISNTNVNTTGGVTSVADANGNLLFYTDGITVWNKLHQVMANGSGLPGNANGLQNVIILPEGNQSALYNIVTVDPLRRSVVNTTLSAGLGSVTAKSLTLSTFNNTIKNLAAGVYCDVASVYTRDINGNHVGSSYVLSTGGSWSQQFGANGFPQFTNGGSWLKASPSHMIRAEVIQTGPNSFFTGIYYVYKGHFSVSGNTLALSSGTALGDLYSCEFSPDGTKFYVTSPGTKHIYQWDLCAGSPSAIVNSLHIISTGTTSVYGLQLSPDGKLYGASNPSLSVVNYPDLAGAACGFTAQQQSIGSASCGLVLPNFSSHYFRKPLVPLSISYKVDTISCKTASFSVYSPSSYSNCSASREAISAVKWNFGDPMSGIANTSTMITLEHLFSGPGTFPVQVIVERGCEKDTINQQVVIPGPWPVFSISGDMTICTNESTTITASGTDSYLWTGNITGSVLVVSPTVSTTYTVVGKNASSACEAKSTFSITFLPCVSTTENESASCKLNVFQNENDLMIRLTDMKNCDVQNDRCGLTIRDLSGRIVLYDEPKWNEGNSRINVSAVPAGVYFISVESRLGVMPIRFVMSR